MPSSFTRAIDLGPAMSTLPDGMMILTYQQVEDGAAEPGDLPQPTIRAILRNDGPSVRPTDLHDVLLAHADEGLAPPDPRNLRRVDQGRLAGAGLHQALSGEFVPLDPSPVAVAR